MRRRSGLHLRAQVLLLPGARPVSLSARSFGLRLSTAPSASDRRCIWVVSETAGDRSTSSSCKTEEERLC